jgi:UDP-N-acetylmuramate dehydrogenase
MVDGVRDSSRDLAALTTLGLGGPAGRLVETTDQEQVVQIVRDAGDTLLVLAGGSNVVVADEGFPGTVLLLRTRGVRVTPAGEGLVDVTAAAGEPWDDLVARAVAEGWSGLECLSGIPGSTGATPIQNVGAYGQEVAEVLRSVTVYDRYKDETVTIPADECGLAYRTSRFKYQDRHVVQEVTFRLAVSPRSVPLAYAELAGRLDVPTGGRAGLAEVREAVLALRRGKGMVLDPADPDTRSAGSFFTNPVLDAAGFARFQQRVGDAGVPPVFPAPDGGHKLSAGWLIDRAGFGRGYLRGRVGLSTKHPLALTNRGGGTTAELLRLAREVRDGVAGRFGVLLHPEPVLVNCAL